MESDPAPFMVSCVRFNMTPCRASAHWAVPDFVETRQVKVQRARLTACGRVDLNTMIDYERSGPSVRPVALRNTLRTMLSRDYHVRASEAQKIYLAFRGKLLKYKPECPVALRSDEEIPVFDVVRSVDPDTKLVRFAVSGLGSTFVADFGLAGARTGVCVGEAAAV